MIVTFKSRAAGDVIMFGNVAQRMLEIIGKDKHDAQGIVTVEQLPGAIAALRASIAADKDKRAEPAAQDDDVNDEAAHGMEGAVALWQRAAPLVELMEYSLKESQPVLWE